MDQPSSEVTTIMEHYQTLCPIHKAKVRTIVRLMLEIQDLQKKISKLQILVIRKNKTASRLISKALDMSNN